MKKKLTVLLLVLAIVAGLFSGCVQSADDNWKLGAEHWDGLEEFPVDDSRTHDRDMGNGSTVKYGFVQENDKYELYINKDRLDIALKQKSSGEWWYSNPTDKVIDESGKADELKSQLILTILDKTDASQRTINSFTDCVNNLASAIEYESEMMPYYLTYNDEGGLRVKYILGDILPDYVVPSVMPVEVCDWMKNKAKEIYTQLIGMTEEEKIAAVGEELINANPMTINQIYIKMTKEEFESSTTKMKEKYEMYVPGIKKIPEGETIIIRSNRLNGLTGPAMEALFALWYEEHKDMEEYSQYPDVKTLRKAWDEEYDVVAGSSAMYMIPVDYILTDDGLKVQIKNDGIVFNESKYVISFIDVLKYFGCADMTEDGYMFTPDGSGALINFNNGKVAISTEFKVQLYGIDRGKNYSKQPDFAEQGHLPVFAIKKPTSTLFAVIEDGEAVGTVVSDIARNTKNNVNYTYSSFRLIETDDMSIFGDNNSLKTYQEEKYSGDICINYSVLQGDIDYADMADTYREYLIKNGKMNQVVNNASDIAFNLELEGAVSDVTAFLGIRYDYLNTLTTYQEAQEILSQLVDGGVKGINVRYRGWANNGLFNTAFGSLRPLNELGGWDGYRKLEKYAAENDIALYPECELVLVYKDKMFDDFMELLDVTRQLSRSNAKYYQYNLMHTGNYMHAASIVRPQKVKSLSESLLKDIQNKNIKAVSLGKMGNILTGDYHLNAIMDRDEVQDVYAEIFKNYSDADISLAVEGGNVYTLLGTDVIYELPGNSSNHYMADEAIPFYQMVVHGYVEYSGEVINQSGESLQSMLKAVETGSGLAYRWMYAPNKDTNNIYFEDVYATCYESWIDEAIEFYVRYNNELGHTASLTITDHDNISTNLTSTTYSDGTVVYVNYDEVEVEVNGKTVPARDYLVIKGGQ
ncbi:MAG: hypothetical protein IKK58_02765 [Clostridia bacterium]|nr:hypothetical protein [Clostridia bacterium]